MGTKKKYKRTTMRISIADYNRMVQDLNDMRGARQTIFVRCACGRLAERGLICPTNMERGVGDENLTCEAGR